MHTSDTATEITLDRPHPRSYRPDLPLKNEATALVDAPAYLAGYRAGHDEGAASAEDMLDDARSKGYDRGEKDGWADGYRMALAEARATLERQTGAGMLEAYELINDLPDRTKP